MTQPFPQDTATQLISLFARITGHLPVTEAIELTPWASLGREGQRQCFVLGFGLLDRRGFLDEMNAALEEEPIFLGQRLIADWSMNIVHERAEITTIVIEVLLLAEC